MPLPSLSVGFNYGAFNAAFGIGSEVLEAAVESKALSQEYHEVQDYFGLFDHFAIEANGLGPEHVENPEIFHSIVSSNITSLKDMREDISTYADIFRPQKGILGPKAVAKKLEWKNQSLSRKSKVDHLQASMIMFVAILLVKISKSQSTLNEKVEELCSSSSNKREKLGDKTDDIVQSFKDLFEENNDDENSPTEFVPANTFSTSSEATIVVEKATTESPVNLFSASPLEPTHEITISNDSSLMEMVDHDSEISPDFYLENPRKFSQPPQSGAQSTTFQIPHRGFHGLQIKDPNDGSSRVLGVIRQPWEEGNALFSVKPTLCVLPSRERKVLDIIDPQSGKKKTFENRKSLEEGSTEGFKRKGIVIKNPLDGACINFF